MKNIRIGTCIPGPKFESWAPAMSQEGFESFSINFHMAFEGVDLEALAQKTKSILADRDIKITALGYYCNALQHEDHATNLGRCIDLAASFGTRTVATFAGGLEGESVDAAMPQFKKVFGELCRRAEDRGVQLAIENCPMGGTWDAVTCNIGFNARAWDMMFEAVPSPSLGLEWEPAHQLTQLVDPLANLRRYIDRVVHVHGKDAVVKRDVIEQEGIFSKPSFVDSRFPGFGQTDWRQVIAILQENDYDGAINIEGYHDPLYRDDWEMTGQKHALKYLKWCRGNDFLPNPWN